MATKQEQELTVEEKLKALYELQQVDSRIDELRTLAGELPQEVKDMGDEIEGLKTRLQNIEDSIKECETQISDYRVRSENANASIARDQEQQKCVRNNREYDNLNKEIEYPQLDIELTQRSGGRQGRARQLRRLPQQDPRTAPVGYPPAQENHRVRVLRTYPRRCRNGRIIDLPTPSQSTPLRITCGDPATGGDSTRIGLSLKTLQTFPYSENPSFGGGGEVAYYP